MINLPSEMYGGIKQFFILRKKLTEENNYLKQVSTIQAARLQKLQSLEIENDRLKNLLNFTELRQGVFSLTKVIDVNPDPFKHQIILNRGLENNIYVGQPVMSAEGLIGSIVAVEPKTSVAMLITDINHAVPVLNLRNGFRAIALGTGDFKQLTLQHVPNTADILERDIFVTSGLGGKYPVGYVVGYVGKIKKEINFPFASVNLVVAAKLDSCQEVLLTSTKN
jgi:rod shape-determining protein MreC